MKGLQKIQLEAAATALANANTPLFLLRKLRTDRAARDIANAFEGDAIIAELEKLTAKKPRNLHDAVLPYVLLVALSFKPRIDDLEKAAKINGRNFDWFEYMVSALRQSYYPTLRQELHLPGILLSSSASASTASASATNKIILP